MLDAANLAALDAYLGRRGWLSAGPAVSAQRIGDGNMNMTVRVRANQSSFILKQARPWVVKYPQIPAPIERAAVEAAFYGITSQVPAVGSRMPRLLGFDPDCNLLCLEDLGEAGDLMRLYRTGRMTTEQCCELTEFLVELHSIAVPDSATPILRNRAMRKLSHEHQYDLPLRPENGIDLDRITPGLSALAEDWKSDQEFRDRIAELGQSYLADGSVLVHGDFFPGSWLTRDGGIAIIDPEFCYLGAREYDLGVFWAHLELLHSRPLWDVVLERYTGAVDWVLVRRYAGAEIMRRLIGVAQLPLSADLAAKRKWLELSRDLVCAE